MLIIQAESVCPKPTVSALDGLRGAARDWVLGVLVCVNRRQQEA